MTDETTGAPIAGGPARGELTNAEKLTALQTYMKALKPMETQLREDTAADMRRNRAERVGAFMPDGTKIGTVGYSNGRKTAGVTDQGAALLWCLQKYPEEIVKAVNPAFLKALTDYAAATGSVGEPGVDPRDGEVLPFITVKQGDPFVSVTTTKEGVAQMTALAHGFAGMLEAPQQPATDPGYLDEPYDPAFWAGEPGSTGPSYGAGPGEGR